MNRNLNLLQKTKIIDFSNYDRILAIIVAGNNLYVSDCDHQDALEMLCQTLGYSTGIDWDDPVTAHEKAVKLTDRLFLENRIQGFDVFEGDENQLYLTAHYPENLQSAYPVIRKYAEEHNCILGTFIDCSYRVQLYK